MSRDAIVNVTDGGGVLPVYPIRKFFVMSYEAAAQLFEAYVTDEVIKIFAFDEDQMRIEVVTNMSEAHEFFKGESL